MSFYDEIFTSVLQAMQDSYGLCRNTILFDYQYVYIFIIYSSAFLFIHEEADKRVTKRVCVRHIHTLEKITVKLQKSLSNTVL